MRLRLTIAYAGTAYAGWQRQPASPTVQGELEAALSRLSDVAVEATGASRTDAGVHALGQVAHADVPERRVDWMRALNALLPADIRVLAADQAAPEFHARYDATGKTYVYCIDPRPVAMPMLAPWCWHVPAPLDVATMRAAARGLVGPIDQRAFASRPDERRALRPVDRIEIEAGRVLTVTVRGRSFLRFAVRGMVGALVQAGLGKLDGGELARLARCGDRAAAPPPAPAHGLSLARVDYGAH